jgi:hypothetical protein
MANPLRQFLSLFRKIVSKLLGKRKVVKKVPYDDPTKWTKYWPVVSRKKTCSESAIKKAVAKRKKKKDHEKDHKDEKEKHKKKGKDRDD